MKKEILEKLEEIVKKLTNEDIKISLNISKDINRGDFTTNIAFSLSKILGKNPNMIAQEIAEKFRIQNSEFRIIDRVEVVGGFINFYLKPSEFLKKVEEFVKNPQNAGKTESLKNQKISVEYTDPNPFKEFHIGHLYTNTVGESLARIFEANGAVVWRGDYFGDVGMHVAKSIYGILKNFEDPQSKFHSLDDLEKVDLKERIKFLGECYALGSSLFEELDSAKKEIKEINKLAFIAAQRMWVHEKAITLSVDYVKAEKIDEEKLDQVYKLYEVGRAWSLKYFDSIYERVGMKFNGYYPESLAAERGYQLVMSHIDDGVFEKSQGAVIFPGEKYGLHSRVFINSLGLPTYEAKELGLAGWKYEDFKYDKSYIVTGSEITEYFKVLIKALSLISPDLAEKTTHVPHGMVRLPEGKMSSRTGKIVLGEWLLDKAVKKASSLSSHSGLDPESSQKILKQGFDDEHSAEFVQDDNTAEMVGIGAVKYAFLKSGIGKDIEFDLDKSLSLNGNSGPYLQYTYVRTQSILEKAGENVIPNLIGNLKDIDSRLRENDNTDELNLLRKIYQFPVIVEMAAENLAPNMISEYLFDLSQTFNLFYQKKRILNAENEELKNLRLLITISVGIVLKNGLRYLGIVAPKKM